MTVREWADDFKEFINELQMPRDDYKGIMEYIDDGFKLLKDQEAVVRCKDCIHYYKKACIKSDNKYDWEIKDENWFCADGERRTSDD